jgi:hypothetical protein
MVVDRQKGQNQIRVQEVQSGRQAHCQAGGYKVPNRQGSKPGGLEKAGERGRKCCLTWKHTRQTGTERQETDKYTGEDKDWRQGQ